MAIEDEIESLKNRIEMLEKSAHTEHTLSSETINQIVKESVLQMHNHLKKVLNLGKTLLQEDE